MTNKWISISISGVLVAVLAASLLLYFQEFSNLKDAQAEIDVLEVTVSTQELDLWGAKAGVSALEAELAAAEVRISALEAALVATGSTYEVDAYDNFFSPARITVPVGTTVTWTNAGFELHTVMMNSGLFEADLAFRDSFSYTFTEPGRYYYHCHRHPDNMIGGVIVE